MVKYCNSCKAELYSAKEKITGTCNACALEANKGFELMAKGKFRQGLKKVLDVKFARDDERTRTEKELVQLKMKKALNKKQKIIRRKLKKKGLSEEEINEGLKNFEGCEDE